MAEELKKHGLFVDESYTLRVLEPQIAKDTEDLKDENEVFLEKLSDFRKIIHDIASEIESFASEVDKQKMIAISTQNLANSSAKQKEIEQQQIQTKIIEKSLELDRLKIELKYLQKCESDLLEANENYKNQ